MADGLYDRIAGVSKPPEDAREPEQQRTAVSLAPPVAREARPRERQPDPYASLKSDVHRAVVEKLGPLLFAAEASGELGNRVVQSVGEELVAHQVPLTREERQRIVREISDDILGYG